VLGAIGKDGKEDVEDGGEVGETGDEDVAVGNKRWKGTGVGIEKCEVSGSDAAIATGAVDGTDLRVATGKSGKGRFGGGDAGGGGRLETGLRARERPCSRRCCMTADVS
jgi:hypothetical protein